MTRRMGHFVGQAKPQRMGTPYYPSLSLLPLPVRIWSPSSVSHQGARASAAGVVAGPVDEMMTGISIIEGIDLDAEIPCTHSQHESWHANEPAAYVVHNTCPCGRGATYPLCESGWRIFQAAGESRCPICQAINVPAAVLIVEVLR